MAAADLGYNLQCNACGRYLNADGIVGTVPSAPGFVRVSQARAFAAGLPAAARWRTNVTPPDRHRRPTGKNRHDYCPTCKEHQDL